MESKLIFKPNNYTIKDTYAFYIKNLIKKHSSYFIHKSGAVYNDLNNEISYIIKVLKLRKEEEAELNFKIRNEEGNLYSLRTDLSDVKIAIEALEKRRKEIIKDPNSKVKIIDFKLFKKILLLYNTKAGDKIIHGHKLALGPSLGFLEARRVERNFSKKVPDWYKSNKLKEENGGEYPTGKDGKKLLIYHSSEEWCRVYWQKNNTLINGSAYYFLPSGGQPGRGFRQAFSRANSNDPKLKLLYPFKTVVGKRDFPLTQITESGEKIKDFYKLSEAVNEMSKKVNSLTKTAILSYITKRCESHRLNEGLKLVNFPYYFKYLK